MLGTSAEDADSDEVGQGNQVNGLIALNRPRGLEVAAGKNPVSHVGKICNVLTYLLAHRIYTQIPGLRGLEVWICSRIGEPVDRPQIASVQIHLQPGINVADVTDPIRRVVKEELARMPVFCNELAQDAIGFAEQGHGKVGYRELVRGCRFGSGAARFRVEVA